jgi:hypothetical protein
MAAAARFDKSGLRQLSRNRMAKSPRPALCGRGRRLLTHCAFAQAGFQLVVLVNHILFGGALIGNALNVDGAVLVLRRFGYRA